MTAKEQTGNHSLLKRLNRSSVLHLLRQNEGLSRRELTGLTQLDGKTITNVTQDLLKLKMIKPVGSISRGVGRPMEIVALNPNYGFALGIDLGASHVACVGVNFSGDIIARSEAKIKYGVTPEKIIKQMILHGNKVLDMINHSNNKLLGIGVCVPGTVDRETGTGIWAANLAKWKNVQLRKPIESAFKTTAFFDESTRCAALGEMFARVREDLNNFLLIDLSLGIGSAFVQKGQLHYGSSELAGEIGHTTIKPGGMQCRCGKKGCLEAEASGYAIAEKCSALLANQQKVKKHSPNSIISTEDAVKAIASGNDAFATVFDEAAYLLGTAAANAVMLLNPAHVILVGGLTHAKELLMCPFREALRSELRPDLLESLQVEISQLGNDAGPLGAASLVLNKIYMDPKSK